MKLTTLRTAAVAAMAAGTFFCCSAGTVAWYRFDEGELGERVGASVVVENAANPGVLTGFCRQHNSSGGISDVDSGYMPAAACGFGEGNGVIDPDTREKHPNGRAFSFVTSNFKSNANAVHNGDGGCVMVPQTDALHLSNFTLECFFKMAPLSVSQTNTTSQQILVCLPKATQYASGKDNYAFALYVHSGKDQILARICDSSGAYKDTFTSEKKK